MPRPSLTRRLLRQLHIDDLRDIVDFYELSRSRAKEEMIDAVVREVGPNLMSLVSPEGPWTISDWNDVLDDIGGDRRRNFDGVRDELTQRLDNVAIEFDMSQRLADLRDDVPKTRRLAQLLDIDHEALLDRLQNTHGRTLLDRFIAGLRASPTEHEAPDVGHIATVATVAAPTVVAPTPAAASIPPDRVFETVAGYSLTQSLGGGGMSQAWKAITPGGETVFLKRAPTSGYQGNAIQREQQIYERLLRREFPHVVKVLDYQHLEHQIILVTEFAAGGTLRSYIEAVEQGGELSARAARTIAQEILVALRALHRENVVHRDLKPDNVLRHNDQWLLADFGIAKNLDRLMTQFTFQMTGTPGYAAPEQMAGAEAHPTADVYSFGKVLTFLLTGQTDPDRIQQQGWRQLARQCVREDPSARPTTELLEEMLRQTVV